MSTVSRRLAIGAAVLALLLTADTMVWAWANRQLSAGLREQLALAGWSLDAGAEHWSGWPIAAELVLENAVTRAGPGSLPPLEWTVSRLRVRLAAWSPTRLLLEAEGRQTLSLVPSAPLPFTAAALTAAIDLRGRDAPRLQAAALAIDAPPGRVGLAGATVSWTEETWSVALTGLSLPGPAAPITPPVDSLRLDGRISPALVAEVTVRDSAERWRSGGGHLDVTMRELRWGALSASGEGSLVLDPSLQPEASGQVKATGLPAALAQLATNGVITPSTATAAGAILVILSAPSGAGPVTLPFALRNGVLAVARIPLLRFAPIDWERN